MFEQFQIGLTRTMYLLETFQKGPNTVFVTELFQIGPIFCKNGSNMFRFL